jgi:hypothetical protein
MVGKMSLDLLNHETLKFLMLFRESGSSLYFIFRSYILIFVSFVIFFFILTFFIFFLSLSHFFFILTFLLFLSLYNFSFFFLINFFICSPLNSKISLYLPLPPCLEVCLSSGKVVIEIR